MNANRFKLGAATVAVASALTAAYTLGHANAPLSQPASAGARQQPPASTTRLVAATQFLL